MTEMDTGAQPTAQAPEPTQEPQPPQAPPSFQDSLPEGVRDHELFKGLENPNQLGERLQNWQQRPEIPQTAEEYYGGQEMAQKLGPLHPLIHQIAEDARQAGMPREQFMTVVNGMAKQHHAQEMAMVEQANKALESLKTKWGDEVEQNLGIANRVLSKFGGETLDQMLEAKGLSNDPQVIEMFHRIGLALEDDSIIRGDGPAGGSLTMKEKIDRMYSNSK